jgi:hypothetical protein
MKQFGKDCLTALPKQGNSLIAFGYGKSVKVACKTAADREILHKRLKCVTKIHPLMNEAVEVMTQKFVTILEVDSKDRLPGVCCTFFKFKARLLTAAATKCPKVDVDYFQFFLDGFSGDVVDLLCNGLSHGSEKCTKTLEKIPPVNNSTGFTSFIPPLLLILDSL